MITRHFIDLEMNGKRRRVHYRKVGNGPPLLMVHQSPRSSKEYEALMEKWSAYFTCIAPDTPGFGQSDPLEGEPEIDEFADATIAFLDAIGVEKCAAYGFHSGGIILVTALKRHPNRFTTLAVGGYAIWTPEEMGLFSDKYLPEFHPSAYGEHLTWLWNRILEQTWFFPWFAVEEKFRLSVAHDDPERVDAVVREMLDAGNAYRAGYGAVLRAPRDIPAEDSNVPPCLITAYDGDPLQEHIDRLGAMPKGWSARKVATPDLHQTASLEHLLAADTPVVGALNETSNGGFIHVVTDIFDGLIHWRGNRDTNGLHVHAPARDVQSFNAETTLAIDLPGHGQSDDWDGPAPVDWSAWQDVIDAAAVLLTADEIIFPDIPTGEAELLYPELSPDRFGNYLTTAWQIVRARTFFNPWYTADADHATGFEEKDISPAKLAQEHLTLINARAAKNYHLALQSKQGET